MTNVKDVARAAVVVAMVLWLCSSAALAGVQYTVTDLGNLGGNYSQACGINNSGQVVGHSYTTGGWNRAFLYSGGHMTDLGTLPGGAYSEANGINDAGQVVGWASIGSGAQRAFLYSGGVMSGLSTSGNFGSVANGINDAGQVVGYWGQAYGDGVSPDAACLWSNGTMTITDLGNLGGNTRSANGINDAGQVVGWARIGSNLQHAFLYSGGHMTDLGTLGGSGVYSAAVANGINDAGQVVGYSYTTGNAQHAFLYSGGVMSDIGTLGGLKGQANGINDAGQVVGTAYTQAPNDGTGRAFLYSGAVLTDLNSLVSPTSGWTLEDATAINDNGQIVGYGINSGGQRDAFLLTPVPEPATLPLLALGGALALLRRRSASS
jgi:probable HAF family extracellular repeat protein